MPNLARTPASSTQAGRRTRERDALQRDLLERLRVLRVGAGTLPGLVPATYARTHAAFELLSDQRLLVTAHLAERFVRRGGGPISVLAVGCGDGTLDAPLASSLADVRPLRPVRYVGVDPYGASTRAFTTALDGLDRPTLTHEVHTSTFDEAQVTGTFDIVTFVHSMYYVPDVEHTLRSAHALLRPGGELVVLSAPRAHLNALVEVLAPPVEGHPQWFSDDVAVALRRTGLSVEAPLTLHAGFDSDSATDEVLDFAVQARLTPELRPLVRAYLEAVAVPARRGGAGRRTPHPVDVFRVVQDGTHRPSPGTSP